MKKNHHFKILVSQSPIAHPYLQQLYSKITKMGIKVYAPESMLDFIKKSIKANVIHLHWIENFIRTKNFLPSLLKAAIFISGLLFLKLLGKKVVITLHNIKSHENIHPQLEYIGFWSCLHISNAVIVHSEYAKKEVLAFYSITGEKVTVIPHGNFVSYYPNVIGREKARDILKIPQSKFVILYLGMIRPYKGLDDLITVLNDILTAERNIIAVICGQAQDKNLQADLLQFSAKFSSNCIAKLEYIHDDEVQVFMNAADVGILPYRYITTSGALLLFMSFQKPVIVPDLEPIKEMLGEEGIYFKAGNTKSLEEALRNSQSMNLSDISRRIYAKALKFSWDDIAAETVAVYRNVTK
jgi:glycosyltransferase involved in cell wall biosynthesis